MTNPNDPTPAAPEILVQIVHIEGPRKGEIQEFLQPRISVGRDPACDVSFPKDLRIVSRHHAEINREGNRFLLVNRSPNGCFVNSRPTEEAYLKQGDVIAFAEGGPKVSFLCTVQAAPRARPAAPAAPAFSPLPAPAEPAPRAAAKPEEGPFTVQYGTSIRSFRQPSIRLGRDAGVDFAFGDPRVFGTHAEVRFRQGQYYLRDLTESHATLLNGRSIASEAPLADNDLLELSEGGPRLRYLGLGRFAEVVETRAEPPAGGPAGPEPAPAESPAPSFAEKVRSLFRR